MLKLATKFVPRQPAFEMAYQAGFRAAELWSNAATLAEWEAVARQARHYPFQYVLHFPNRLEQPPATLEHAVLLYRALQCQTLVIHQPHFDRYGQALLQLEPSLNPAVENHKLSPPEFEQWAEQNPGLTLDVEHFWKFTEHDAPLDRLLSKLQRFLSQYGRTLRHVHLPGYLPGCDEHRPMYASRDLVFVVLSLLDAYNFGGLIVSEVDLPFQNPLELRMDVLLFDAWRQQHDPLAQ